MNKIREIKRQPNADVVAALEGALKLAKSGEMTGVVIVGDLADERQFFRHSEFTNRWTLLGALEYAKDGVNRA